MLQPRIVSSSGGERVNKGETVPMRKSHERKAHEGIIFVENTVSIIDRVVLISTLLPGRTVANFTHLHRNNSKTDEENITTANANPMS